MEEYDASEWIPAWLDWRHNNLHRSHGPIDEDMLIPSSNILQRFGELFRILIILYYHSDLLQIRVSVSVDRRICRFTNPERFPGF